MVVRLACVQPLVLESFRRARLTDLFVVHDTVEAAESTPLE